MFSRLKVVDRKLKRLFYSLGYLVGQHYYIFITLPFIISIVLSTGMSKIEYSTDPDHLLTPLNGEGRQERALAERHFPTNFTSFDAPRSIKFGLFGYVMVTSRDGSSILQHQAWQEVRKIQNMILEMRVEYKGRLYRYSDICAKWNGECYTNSILSFADTFSLLSRGVFRESVEDYFTSYRSHVTGLLAAKNLSRASLQRSQDLLLGVERIRLVTNQTLEELKLNLGAVSKVIEEFENVTGSLYEKFQTQVLPSFEAFNLPAYFGGITLGNQTLDTGDFCQIFSYIRPEMGGRSCTNPLELYSAFTEFLQQAGEMDLRKTLIHKLKLDLKSAVMAVDIKESTDQMISTLTQMSSTLDQFSASVLEDVIESDNLDLAELVEAEAVLLGGLIDSDNYQEVGEIWEVNFLNMIDSLTLNLTQAAPVVSNSLKLQMIKGVEDLTPVLIGNTILSILFSMAVCFTSDITTSKPWVGFAGVLTTIISTFSGFGALVYLGQEFTNFNYGAIFIMIGIGLDDTFVLMNSWHRTDKKADIPHRLGETMSEAGVSILITSLTDVLSFYSAIIAPYPYVRIFCVYTGTCILILFILQITMFAGCLALSGVCEEEGRSGLTLQLVDTDTRYQECLCLKFGKYQVNTTESEKKKQECERRVSAVRVLRKLVRSRTVRISTLFLYIGYVMASVYGIMNVVVYFDKTKLINKDSSMKQFVDLENRLFRDNSFSISVILTGDVRYSDPETMARIENLLHRLEASPYINEHLTRSWLRHLHTVTRAKAYLLLHNEAADATTQTEKFATEAEFVASVREFFRNKTTPYSLDIELNDEGTRILASRFLVQGQNIHSTKDEEAMVTELRTICREASDANFEAHVFNSYFIYTDQYLTIFGQTLQCIFVTGLIVITVSLILLPDMIVALSGVISIVSTLLGTLGFMSLWGIVLDGVTLINLIMCIGFSVDFSAHFCYHYIDLKSRRGGEGSDAAAATGGLTSSASHSRSDLLHSRKAGGNSGGDCVSETLVVVLKPILQGAVSTILGVAGMLFAPSYAYVIFFKMILIVIVLGVVHSLVLVPLLLQFLLDVEAGLKSRRSAASNSEPHYYRSYSNSVFVERL